MPESEAQVPREGGHPVNLIRDDLATIAMALREFRDTGEHPLADEIDRLLRSAVGDDFALATANQWLRVKSFVAANAEQERLREALEWATNRFHDLDGFLAEEASRTNGERFDRWAKSAAQGRNECRAALAPREDT